MCSSICSLDSQRMDINIVPSNAQHTSTWKWWVLIITYFKFENSVLINKRSLTFLSERSSEIAFYTNFLCGHYIFPLQVYAGLHFVPIPLENYFFVFLCFLCSVFWIRRHLHRLFITFILSSYMCQVLCDLFWLLKNYL